MTIEQSLTQTEKWSPRLGLPSWSPRLTPRLFLYGLLLVMMVWPAVMLVVGSFRTLPPGFESEWTTEAWRTTFTGAGIGDAVYNSMIISVVTTLFATAIAAALAFLSERTDAPLRRWILPGLLIAFATPPLFYALGYSFLGNKYTGWLNNLGTLLFGIDYLVDIETWSGLIVASIFKKVAIIYLFLIGPFRSLSPAHDDASLVSGASQFKTFFSISLPSLTPAISGAVLLGLVGGLQAFDLVLILGWPQGINVIATRILLFVTGMSGPDYAKASVLSIALVAVVGVLCWGQARLLGKKNYVTVVGKAGVRRRIGLQRARPLVGTAIALFLVLAVLFPIGSVLFTSFQPIPGVYENFSLRHYVNIFQLPRVTSAVALTFTMSILVGLLAMFLAILIAQISRGLSAREFSVVRFVTYIPLAMPGAVTALAISSGVISVPGLQQLYGSSILLLLALIIAVIPFAIQVANAAVVQIAPELQEAAQVCGASPRRTFIDVTLWLLAPSFFAGWFMAAVIVSGNLEIPLLLKAPDLNLVATVVYNLNSTSDFSAASALLVVLLAAEAAVLLTALGLWKLLGRLYLHRKQSLDELASGV
ncbi:MAG: ABC transporter permease subunit [Spongiibacteraceae bacterium]|jgi:iron(III) transport system permease protein|nr:ABC transporter permease subunit [Spongiibacteraceae bacterium]